MEKGSFSHEKNKEEEDALEQGSPYPFSPEINLEKIKEEIAESDVDKRGITDKEYIEKKLKEGRAHLTDIERIKESEKFAPKRELIKELELKKEIQKKPEISKELRDAITIFNYEVQSKIEILAGGREARRFPDEKAEEAREFIESTYSRLIEEKMIRTQADEDAFIRNLEVITPAGKKILEEFKAARLHNLEGTV